jgi:hypothetical protein
MGWLAGGPAKMAAKNKCLARSNKSQTRLTSSLTFCTFGHPRCVQYRRPRRQPNAWPHPAVGAAALNPPPPHPQTPPARHPAPHQHPAPPPDREADNSPQAIPGLSRPSGLAPSDCPKNEALSNSTPVTAVTSFENRQAHRSSQLCTLVSSPIHSVQISVSA